MSSQTFENKNPKAFVSSTHNSGDLLHHSLIKKSFAGDVELNDSISNGASSSGNENINSSTLKTKNYTLVRIQKKLKINQPGDSFEQEADRIAEQVMRMPDPLIISGLAVTSKHSESKNRKKISDQKKQDELFQKKHSPSFVKETIMSGEVPMIVHEVLQAPGQPLDKESRAFFEQRFGHDFSNVHVHIDSSAQKSAQNMNAHAYTVANNIVFGSGKFSPQTRDGRRLIAHELTHVLQQREQVVLRQEARSTASIPISVLSSSQALVAEKVLADLKDKGGITVAIWVRHVGSEGTFKGQAEQYAADHGALATSGKEVRVGQAMAVDKESVGSLLAHLRAKLGALFPNGSEQKKRLDKLGVKQDGIPIQNLALFTHGEHYGLQVATGGSWKEIPVGVAKDLAPHLTNSPRVVLFACLTAGELSAEEKKKFKGLKKSDGTWVEKPKPWRHGKFARGLKEGLEKELKTRFTGSGQMVSPEVWGHVTKGHTTRNPELASFGAITERNFLDELSTKFLLKAEEKAGFKAPQAQKARFQQRARSSMYAIFASSGTDPSDPRLTYMREIPHLGIEMVWRQLNGDKPNFVGLTSKAAMTAADGLKEFRKLLASEEKLLVDSLRRAVKSKQKK